MIKNIVKTAVVGIMLTGVSYADMTNKDFQLTSPTVKEGKAIGENHYWNQFGCSGKNERPALSWKNAPKDTKSFAVTFYDHDAPTGSGFWHWVTFNIPANTNNITSKSLPTGSIEAHTDLEKPGFFGVCPPKGRKHTYEFTLHALNVENLNPPKGASGAIVRFFINAHTIQKATLSATAGPRK